MNTRSHKKNPYNQQQNNNDPNTGKPYDVKAPKTGWGLFGDAARKKEARKKALDDAAKD